MNRAYTVLILLAGVSAAAPVLADADTSSHVLLHEFSTPYYLSFGTRALPGSQLTEGSLTLGYSSSFGDLHGIEAAAFDSVPLSTADIGKIFVSNRSNNPQFARFALLATNGVADPLVYSTGPFSRATTAGREAFWQFNNTVDSRLPGAVDYVGYRIDSVTVEMLDWYVESPGRDPNGDGIWAEAFYKTRYRVYGQAIPTPTAASLAALACVAVWSRRRR